MSDYRSRIEAALQARYKGTPGKWADDIDREIGYSLVCAALEDALPELERVDATERPDGPPSLLIYRVTEAIRVARGQQASSGVGVEGDTHRESDSRGVDDGSRGLEACRVTDQEVLATFMEPVPGFRGVDYPVSVGRWWDALRGRAKKEPRKITLNECRLIEARLSDEQWRLYESLSVDWWSSGPRIISSFRAVVNASAAQKIAALAAVLRATVSMEKGQE